jgi:lambda family phage tail tape measure protein
MAADIRLTVDGNQALRTLDQIADRVDKVKSAFAGLTAAIAGLALAKSVAGFADEISDISKATGIATANVIAFSNALAGAGGKSADTGTFLNTFVRSIDEAAQGSAKAQGVFKELGISLDDLRKNSEAVLLEKAIDGLRKIEDPSRRAAIALDFFGKSAKSLDPDQLLRLLRGGGPEGERFASSLEKWADLTDNLTAANGKFRLAFIEAFAPVADYINDFLANIKYSEEAYNRFVTVIQAAGVVTALGAIVTVAGLVTSAIGSIVSAVTVLIGVWPGIAAAATAAFQVLLAVIQRLGLLPFAALLKAVYEFIDGLIESGKYFDNWGDRIGNAIARTIEAFGRLIAIVLDFPTDIWNKIFGTNITGVGTRLADAAEGARKAEENMSAAARAAQALFTVDDTQMKSALDRQDRLIAADKLRQENVNRNVKPAALPRSKSDDAALRQLQRELEEINKIGLAYKNAGEENIRRINNQTVLINLSQNEREVQQALQTAAEEYAKVQNDLLTKRDAIKGKTEQERQIITAINDQIKKNAETYAQYQNNVRKSVEDQQDTKLIFEEQLRLIERITEAQKRQASQSGAVANANSQISKSLSDALFEGSQQRRNPLERTLADIERKTKETADQLKKSIADAFNLEGDTMNPAMVQEMADRMAEVDRRAQALSATLKNNVLVSREWNTGWTDAFNKFIDDATNAARSASDAFNGIVGRVNSAFDGLANGTRDVFKTMIRGIITDLTSSALKRAFADLLKSSGIGSGGGIAGLFSGLFSGLFGSSGPVNAVPGMDNFGNFAGVFGAGGAIPAGSFGVVGERGPELVRGPAMVTPQDKLGGPTQNTYVTNNINAVDAQSVAQLFMNNRKMLLGATEAARREMPGRMR